jgi:hypothetical protein
MSGLIVDRLDAAESAFLQRQLEYIKPGLMEVKYPEFLARQFLPVNSQAGDGVDTIIAQVSDSVGEAKLISDYGKDFPRADTFTREYPVKIRDIGVSYGWSLREIRAAARAGVALTDRKARAARKAVEKQIDEIACFGHSDAGLKGFLNHSDVDDDDAGNGDWANASVDDILADVNEGPETVAANTNGVWGKNLTLLLPDAKYMLLAQRRLSDSNLTLLQFIMQTNPFIKAIAPWYKLKNAGAGGAKDRMVFYERTPEVLELEIPFEFEQFEAQQQGLEFVVPCRAATAGLNLHHPQAVLYRDNI